MSQTTTEQQLRWMAGATRPAETLERRYQRAHVVAGLWAGVARLLGQTPALRSLAELMHGRSVRGARAAGLRSVPLAQIVASESRSADFDQRFRPLQTHTWDRWRSVALALWQGDALPPVELIEIDGRYAVRDGHHRISAASVLGMSEIDALVTVIEVG